MSCRHDGFHTIGSQYDLRSGVLIYVWTCERCGERLKEAQRLKYRPSFDPHGNKRHLALSR
jgi:hypothetical protein